MPSDEDIKDKIEELEQRINSFEARVDLPDQEEGSNTLQDDIFDAIEELDDLTGPESLGERSEPAKVAEEHAHLSRDELAEALWATTLAKLAVANPRYRDESLEGAPDQL